MKGRKGFTQFQNAKSKQQQFKTGVPQGGVLSPILFNLYTSDLPPPPTGVTILAYADDMTPAATHSDYHIAEQRLQPYLQDIFNWTKINSLTLNPDKSTATLFTSDKREQNISLNLSINNISIPTTKNPKILGLTLDPSLSFGEHIRITKEKADSSLKILKALSATKWGKQKETLTATYKAITLPVIEYASTIWSPIISDVNLNKLQIIQNDALRTITGCTSDTNTQHLHVETKILPLRNHIRLHASQMRQKSQLPTHPLHDLNNPDKNLRQKKETIFDDWSGKTIRIDPKPDTPTPDSISQSLKTIHTMAVSECISEYKPNPILLSSPPDIDRSEEFLSRGTRRILAQLLRKITIPHVILTLHRSKILPFSPMPTL